MYKVYLHSIVQRHENSVVGNCRLLMERWMVKFPVMLQSFSCILMHEELRWFKGDLFS